MTQVASSLIVFTKERIYMVIIEKKLINNHSIKSGPFCTDFIYNTL